MSKVVIVKSGKAFKGEDVDPKVLSTMLNQGLCRLFEASNAKDSVNKLFKASHTVGIKVNPIAGRHLTTHPELAMSFAKILVASGLKDNRIIIFDRTNRELKGAGYQIYTGKSGVRCFGTDQAGYGYEPRLTIQGDLCSQLSRIVSECDALVSMPVMKDHNLSGVCGAMKNLYGIINNPNKYHDNNCTPYLCDLLAIPEIKRKLKLCICDALRVQYHGGPGYKPQYAVRYGAILLSTDAVALDRVIYEIISQMREKNGISALKDMNRYPRYIFEASSDKYSLGVSDIQKIERLTVEV